MRAMLSHFAIELAKCRLYSQQAIYHFETFVEVILYTVHCSDARSVMVVCDDIGSTAIVLLQ